MGTIFAPTRFSLVRISIRDLVADRKSLVRNSGVGGGGQNPILMPGRNSLECKILLDMDTVETPSVTGDSHTSEPSLQKRLKLGCFKFVDGS